MRYRNCNKPLENPLYFFFFFKCLVAATLYFPEVNIMSQLSLSCFCYIYNHITLSLFSEQTYLLKKMSITNNCKSKSSNVKIVSFILCTLQKTTFTPANKKLSFKCLKKNPDGHRAWAPHSNIFLQRNSWLSGLNIKKYKDAWQINSGNCSLSLIYNMGKSKYQVLADCT